MQKGQFSTQPITYANELEVKRQRIKVEGNSIVSQEARISIISGKMFYHIEVLLIQLLS